MVASQAVKPNLAFPVRKSFPGRVRPVLVPVIVRELEETTPAFDDVVTEMAWLTTVSGSAPFATPYSVVPDFVIAADAIELTMVPLPSLITADTLTAGDDCTTLGLYNTNDTTHAVPDAVPPDAAVNTSSPGDCVHAPLVPNWLDVEDTVKLALVTVCDPVSPVMVTVDPVARLKLAVNETVNVFWTPARTSLCWIDFRLKLGTTTVSGSAPLDTPYSAVPGFAIAADAIEPTMVPLPSLITADTLTAGDDCAVAVLVKVKVTTHAVSDVVPPDAVNTSSPGDCVHAPLVPNWLDVEDTVKLALVTVCDPVSPVMVTVDPVARLKLAVNETVNMLLVAPDTGVLCWIDFRLKLGTTTVSGSAPLDTPYSAVPGFAIAADAIEPTMVPLPSLITADTLTAGDDCAVAVLVKVKVTSHAVSDVVPPDAAVNTSSPGDCVHAPLVPNWLDVEDTVKLALVTVCDPVSPVMVTVDPVARLKLAVNETVNMLLVAPDTGVLCWIDFRLKLGTTTVSGSAPLDTPYSAVPGFAIAADAIEPTMVPLPSLITADTLTAGDDCAVAVLVKVKVTSHAVPDVVPPDAVNTSSPGDCVHAPLVPNWLDVEDTVKLALVTVCDPVSPVMVTVDPVARLKLAVNETVNMLLVAPDTGVLCWIDFRLKLGTTTVSGSAPLDTPYSAVPGFAIAADAIEPTMVPLPSLITADTLTAGDDCAVAVLVKVKVTSHAVSDVVPPDAVNTSSPGDCVHAPLVPNWLDVEDTVKLALVTVCDPVSPVMVTVDPVARLKLAVNETVNMLLVAPDTGVLCWIDFRLKLGTTTVSGSAPLDTPYSAVPGFAIAADAIEPTMVPLPSLITADTLTAGDDCAVAVLVKVKVTTHAVSDVVPPDAVNTSSPGDCVHAPLVPNWLDVEDTVKLALVTVCDPVSPVMVTVDPVARLKLAVNETVNMLLVAPDTGVLCWIDFRLKLGTTTVSGSAPLDTPYSAVPGFAIAADAIEPTMVPLPSLITADTLTAGDDCAVAVLVKVKVTTHAVSDVVPPDAVNTSSPGDCVHAPLVPNWLDVEDTVKLALVTVCDPVSPVMVTVDPVARLKLAVNETVNMLLVAPDTGVLCWIDFRLKLGTTTVSGSAPLDTPYSAVPGFAIAADAIEPTMVPLPSLITADTLTAGDDCAVAVLVKVKVTTHAVSDVVPPDAVNTSSPGDCVHAPLVPNWLDVEDTVKLALVTVCDPVSPVMVTVDPVARLKLAVNETVNMLLVAPDTGVLCWIDFRLKLGTTTVSGSAPLDTPYSAVPGFAIAADAIEPTMVPLPSLITADTLTAGDDCAVAVLVKVKVTSHAVSDVVPPDAAVNTSSPGDCVHAPLVPNWLDVEDTVKLALVTVCDPVSPVMVTVDPVARLKLAVNETVNMLLVAPDTGVLCWIDFRLKLGTTTVSGSAPLDTPYSAVPGFAIAADAIEPTMVPLPSLITADTLTAGDDCAVAVLVKVKVTTHAVSDVVPPDAVNTSSPGDCVHAPLVPNWLDVEDTVKLALVTVCDPVSPVMVTVDPVARLKLAVNETVNMLLVAPDTGVLCWIDFRLKLGTTTVSGSAPLDTPYSAVPGFAIAADAIEPTMVPLPSLITADTLTAGDDCAVAVLVKVKVTTHAVSDVVPPDAVNTSSPGDCVHAPLVPNWLDVEDTVKLALVTVCDPVSPVMVTVDPVARLKLAVNETVNMLLVAPDTGVLCWIDFRLKLGTTTVSGSAPLDTPYSAVPGFAIAADAIVAEPDAAMLMAGDDWAVPGFVIWNRNVYVVDATKVPPPFTVSVKVPELHAPFPWVVPSEKIVSPSSPASTNVMGLVATAPLSPDTVTTEPPVASKAVSDTRVTVIVLLDPAAGLLWPMDLVVKDCAPTATILLANPSKKNTLRSFRKLFLFFEDVWSMKLSTR
jgi:hypothetical protein